jgi:ABC-type uncharacterized transport system permease subunit
MSTTDLVTSARVSMRALPAAATALLAGLAGLIVASLALLLLGTNPIAAWSGIVDGSLGDLNAITNTLRQTAPIALIAVGVSLSFRAGLWNAGGEGQFMVGAAAAVVVALAIDLPPVVHMLASLVVAAVAGTVFSWIAGILREYRGASEILTTLMLNFVGALLASYVMASSLRATFTPGTKPIPASAELSPIAIGQYNIHPGLVVAIVAALVIGVVLRGSIFGLRVNSAGGNADAAELAGIDTRRTRLQVFAIAGALAGLSGGIQVVAVQHALVQGMSPNYGFTAITAALLGGLTMRGTLLASVGMAALVVGGQALQRTSGLNISAVDVIQGALLMTLLAARVIGRADRGWRG